MISEKRCLEILDQVTEDNKNNPHTDLWRMTLSLKHWRVRKQVYLNMKSVTKTESERKLLGDNKWGEDKTLQHLIEDRKMPLQDLLNLVFKMQDIEWSMNRTNVYNQIHLLIPILAKLIESILPIWKDEIIKLKIQKDHLEIRTILAFAFNLRSYDDTEIIDFAITLLNEK